MLRTVVLVVLMQAIPSERCFQSVLLGTFFVPVLTSHLPCSDPLLIFLKDPLAFSGLLQRTPEHRQSARRGEGDLIKTGVPCGLQVDTYP